ncbi:U2 small nuclear ribonucleoprotein auxiliary factor 35 kDa subunit-related protein 2-like [Lytechinus pictus]|uniref:U2 small nuclear ribonucleoprotein auxiliary factor 35 kDa subunit-related protein 2-like n=1 Tax=Lytechinus pictus TaxID=7653 RepID=UPI0030BA21CF
MAAVTGHLPRKYFRAQVRKEKRKRKRQAAAQFRDAQRRDFPADEEEDDEMQNAGGSAMEAEQKETDNCVARNTERNGEEAAWLEREQIAQAEFEKRRKIAEALKEKEMEERKRIQAEWEEQQKMEEEEKEKKDQELESVLLQLDQELGNEKEPSKEWRNPEAPASSQPPGNQPVRAVKKEELCSFFMKTGACRFRERCSRTHPPPTECGTTLMIPGMYTNFGLGPDFKDEYDADIGLECDEESAYVNFHEFYEDVLPEFREYGKVLQLKVCRNWEPHLRGNVYVQYSNEEEAAKALEVFTGRFYGGKQLDPRYCPVNRWKPAICGLFHRDRCPRGKHCNFLHVFHNPRGEFSDADQDRPPRTPSHRRDDQRRRDWQARESRRRSRSRSRSRMDYGRSRKHSRSRSRERNRRRYSHRRSRSRERYVRRSRSRDRDPRKSRSRSRERGSRRSRSRSRERDPRRSRSRSRERGSRRSRSRSRDRGSRRSRSRSRDIHPRKSRSRSRERDPRRSRSRSRDRGSRRSRSRSRERDPRRNRSRSRDRDSRRSRSRDRSRSRERLGRRTRDKRHFRRSSSENSSDRGSRSASRERQLHSSSSRKVEDSQFDHNRSRSTSKERFRKRSRSSSDHSDVGSDVREHKMIRSDSTDKIYGRVMCGSKDKVKGRKSPIRVRKRDRAESNSDSDHEQSKANLPLKVNGSRKDSIPHQESNDKFPVSSSYKDEEKPPADDHTVTAAARRKKKSKTKHKAKHKRRPSSEPKKKRRRRRESETTCPSSSEEQEKEDLKMKEREMRERMEKRHLAVVNVKSGELVTKGDQGNESDDDEALRLAAMRTMGHRSLNT